MPILTRLDYWTAQPNDLLASLAASRDGLTTAEARRRLVTEGRNSVAPPTGHRVLRRIAQRLAARRAMVKRLAAIHDLGAMDVVRTDKTGTLTEGRITLVEPPGLDRADDAQVRELAAMGALVVLYLVAAEALKHVAPAPSRRRRHCRPEIRAPSRAVAQVP